MARGKWQAMLAPTEPVKVEQAPLPCLASCKIDGIRGTGIDSQAISRSGKLLPNKFIQSWFGTGVANGKDGELVEGPPNNFDDTYDRSYRAVMTIEGEPDFDFWVFDHPFIEEPFKDRMPKIRVDGKTDDPRIKIVPQIWIDTHEQLENIRKWAVESGYEGLILRDPLSYYKQGRRTLKQGIMLKVKEYLDSEAEVLYCYEQMHNTNEAKINEVGYTHRSSHKAGLVPAGTLGGFHVRDIHHPERGEFNVGILKGLKAEDRQYIWDHKDEMPGRIFTYSYFPVGMKDAPRHAKYKGWRSKLDL